MELQGQVMYLGHETDYTYDARGRQISSTDVATGAETDTDYDPVTGQVQSVNLPPSVPNGPRGYVSYAYAYPDFRDRLCI